LQAQRPGKGLAGNQDGIAEGFASGFQPGSKTWRHFKTRKRVKVTPVRNTSPDQHLSAKLLQQSD
jgi:hypothetical protein